MVLKARYRLGYRSLVAEVSDSIHLRRFCRISLSSMLASLVKKRKAQVQDRSRSMGRKLRALIRTIRRRVGRGQGGGADVDRAARRPADAIGDRNPQARGGGQTSSGRAWRGREAPAAA
jgi:hypothetical protein